MTNKEAIERLRKIKKLAVFGEDYMPALDLAIAALERDRWIPVTERMPEDAGIYIICDHYGNVMSRHFCKKSDKFAGYWHANGSRYYGNPTHWMPLPEPPKEDSDEV